MKIQIAYLADQPRHIKTIAKWLYTEWGYVRQGNTVEATVERLNTHLNRTNMPITIVATEGEALVGTACIRRSDLETRKNLTPWLSSVYVAEEYRKQGVGSELVSAIEKIAYDLGVRRLYLFTPNRQSFYRRLGWISLEEVEYGEKTVTVMTKRIDCPSLAISRQYIS